jgi:acyl carrier protein
MTHRTSVRPELILDVLRTHFEVSDDTSVDTDFGDLDLDSLVLIELAVMLTKQYGVQLTGEELATASTAAKVAELLSVKVAKG